MCYDAYDLFTVCAHSVRRARKCKSPTRRTLHNCDPKSRADEVTLIPGFCPECMKAFIRKDDCWKNNSGAIIAHYWLHKARVHHDWAFGGNPGENPKPILREDFMDDVLNTVLPILERECLYLKLQEERELDQALFKLRPNAVYLEVHHEEDGKDVYSGKLLTSYTALGGFNTVKAARMYTLYCWAAPVKYWWTRIPVTELPVKGWAELVAPALTELYSAYRQRLTPSMPDTIHVTPLTVGSRYRYDRNFTSTQMVELLGWGIERDYSRNVFCASICPDYSHPINRRFA